MGKDQIEIVKRKEYVGIKSYKVKYIAEVTHRGLNDFKIFSAFEEAILDSKVNAHIAKLADKWDRIVSKENFIKSKDESIKEAEEKSSEAVRALKEIDHLLISATQIRHSVDWESMKDNSKFAIPNPDKELSELLAGVTKPVDPVLLVQPERPIREDFEPKLSLFDKLSRKRKEAKTQDATIKFDQAVSDWEDACRQIERDNQVIEEQHQKTITDYEDHKNAIRKSNAEDVRNWEALKAEFIGNQAKWNSQIDVEKEEFLKHGRDAVLQYCEWVLTNSVYPENFPKSFELDYNPDTKILIVEYSLPSIEQLPTLNEVKYIKNELKEFHISEAQTLRLFDATMYNITLRSIYELFEADLADAINAISFNGWVNAVNKATGKRENNCILSIQAKKAEFAEINLSNVDPKTCFKNFKGVGSSKLSGLTPIQPILQINRTDKRFVNYYEVANSLDSSSNLAAMDWEDFEHLIREVFAKEFSSNGGEVKVTQASRDGGVDAIAFDPDPIRGGKIVIQAKRYTNTVGVSAVRDLYGTVMNEGATKGILVTTADFGSDAYEFVRGKPLTLMNGANLLYLLEKHGIHARIDIREAKNTLS